MSSSDRCAGGDGTDMVQGRVLYRCWPWGALLGKFMIQPWKGRETTKVHVFSSHLMDKLLRGADPTDPYDSAAIGRWCDRVPDKQSRLVDTRVLERRREKTKKKY